MKLLEAISVHILAFKTFLDNLNHVVKTCYFHFTPDGIFIKTIDDSRTIQVESHIPLSTFSRYSVTNNMDRIGLQINYLYKIIKEAKQTDIIEFSVNDSTPDLFDVIITHKNGGKTMSSTKFIKLNELSSRESIFNEHAYVISIKSSEFQSTCKKLLNMDPDEIKIVCYDQYIEFNAEGQINMKIEQSHLNPMYKFIRHNQNAHSFDFTTRNIQLFSKCSSLSDEITLQIQNDMPCMIKYECGIGTLMLTLSPKLKTAPSKR